MFCFVYRAGTKYTVNVFGMFEGGESMPLAGQEDTTYSDDPEPPPFVAPSNTQYIPKNAFRYDSVVLYGYMTTEELTQKQLCISAAVVN